MCLVTNALVDKNPELIKNITTSAITCFRDTAVCLDENKRPIRPCILWCDQRMAKCEKPMPFFRNMIFKIAGIGIIVSILNQILARSDKGEYVMIITLAGIIVVFVMLIPYIEDFFDAVRDIADF
jgi:stage III sporulation protein AC